MKLKAYLVVIMAALGGATALAAPYETTAPASYDGLVAVQTRNLDKLYVRPNADLARYQAVMIDPVTVEFSKNWNRSVNDPRYTTRIRPEDAQPHCRPDDRQPGRHSRRGTRPNAVTRSSPHRVRASFACRRMSPNSMSTHRTCSRRGLPGPSPGTPAKRR